MTLSSKSSSGGAEASFQPEPADKQQADSIKQNSQQVGSIQTQKGEDIILRDYVYSTLWKQVKFIVHENELDFDGLLANNVMVDVNVASDKTIRNEYWVRNRGKIVKWMNQKRNNTIGAVKKEFVSKFRDMVYAVNGNHF
jgi:hypothetical protein